jgi:RimJ/RimL family protein N-acetyltransferase
MKGLHDDQIPQETDPDTGLPIGPRLARPQPAGRPERIVLEGRWCRLEPLDPVRHRDQLFAASTPPDAAKRFRYLFDAVPQSMADFAPWLAKAAASNDPLMYAVIDRRTGRVEGRQTLMRITPEHQSIEIGNIYWGPAISRTPIATEANYLFAEYVFETLGYRRYEWKCDALNAPSRSAAERFGFTYEGHFRRAIINKGRSRDTTWYSMIDSEWPALRAAYQRWLDPANFDAGGRQRVRLRDLTAQALRG